ncbi:MAG: hypothetical protein MZV63_64825 [Marinilabiliales bacterium]|nr:hypothetical protein [Marinilabiliales bacterium]
MMPWRPTYDSGGIGRRARAGPGRRSRCGAGSISSAASGSNRVSWLAAATAISTTVSSRRLTGRG